MTETKVEYEVTVWRCKCGRMLGDAVRINGIRRLTMYREAGNVWMVAAIITGTADITCPECGEVRTWFSPEEGLREFLDRELRRRGIGVESE